MTLTSLVHLFLLLYISVFLPAAIAQEPESVWMKYYSEGKVALKKSDHPEAEKQFTAALAEAEKAKEDGQAAGSLALYGPL